jgi:DNA-3-methyladenine glycosylase
MDLTGNHLYLYAATPARFTLVKRPRIGVDYAKHWARRLLRFYIKNNSFVSKK